MRASDSRTAPATAFAVSVRGAETSMSGVTDLVPRAGPSRAKGAKPVTSPLSDVTSKCEASTSRSADSCRWVYATPLAGPVEPDVKRIAASSSGPGGAGTGARVPSARISPRLYDTPSAARAARGRAAAEMRTPGQRSARAALRPGTSPITKSGHAPRTARVRPRMPSPASATTTTAPIRRHAYTTAESVGPGGMSSETRSPGRTPTRDRPAARHRTRSSSCRQVTRRADPDRRDDMSTIARSESFRRSSSPSQIGRNADVSVDVRAASARGETAAEPPRRSALSPSHASMRGSVVAVFGQEVARALVPVHVGMRKTVDQVIEVAVAEDRVVRDPTAGGRERPARRRRPRCAPVRGGSRDGRRPGCRRRTRRSLRGGRRNGREPGTPARWRHPAAARPARGWSRERRSSPPSRRRAHRGRGPAGVVAECGTPAGWCTAVFSSMTPARDAGWSTAQPSETTPPQS